MADPLVVKVSELTELTNLAADDLLEVVDVSELVTAEKTKKLRATNLKIFTSDQVTDGIITNSKIAPDAVNGTKIADDSIDSEHYVDGSIDAAHLNQTAGSQAVTTAAIRDLNVTNGKLAAGAVTEAKITAKTITNASLADKTVTTAKIADNAVTETQLGAIKRTVAIPVFGREDAVIVKNFVRIFSWPPMLNGHIVVGASAVLLGAVSTSGSVAMTLTNQNGAMTTISIAQGAWSASAGSINANYDEAASFATFSVNVTAAGSGAKGLTIYLEVLG